MAFQGCAASDSLGSADIGVVPGNVKSPSVPPGVEVKPTYTTEGPDRAISKDRSLVDACLHRIRQRNLSEG